MKKHSAFLSALIAFSALFIGLLVVAGPASASESASCTVGFPGDHCVFWSQSYSGAHAGFDDLQINDYAIYNYPNNGTGQGGSIGNNNGSDRNDDTGCNLRLYYNPGYSGFTKTLAIHNQSGYQAAGSGLGNLLNNLRSSKYCV